MAMTKQQNGSQAGVITTELMVPGQKCGLIIGKNGETIKGIQVDSNWHKVPLRLLLFLCENII